MAFAFQSRTKMNPLTLFSIAMDLAGSTKPQDCTTAAYLFRVLLLQPSTWTILFQSGPDLSKYLGQIDIGLMEKIATKCKLPADKLFEILKSHSVQSGSSYLLLWILLLYLRSQMEVARTGLAVAATSRPMYPTLHCIRYLLFHIQLRYMNSLFK